MFINLNALRNFSLGLKSNRVISFILLIWTAFLIIVSLYDFWLVTFNTGLSIISKLISGALIISSLFWLIHCVSYMDKLLRSVLIYNIYNISGGDFDTFDAPKVAVVVPVFNEESLIVESSLNACKHINYKAFEIYLLDDTIDIEKSNELVKLANRLDINYIHRSNRRGFKAGAINDSIDTFSKDTDYLLVVDVDHKVEPHILAKLVPLLGKNTSLSFVQTPQYFTKETKDKLAVLYSIQQHIFNKHLCRGLDVNGAAVMTGSNVLIRLSHLREIGGMDESCITEDIATSFNFQFHGYRGIFLDQIYAEGIAPPNLSAYFIQQTRWAYGTTQNFKRILNLFLKQEGNLGIQQWKEHLLTGSWYLLSGWSFVMSMFLTILTLIFFIKLPVINIGLLLIINSLLVIALIFITLKRERDFHFVDLLMCIALFFGLYFTYARSSAYAILGRKMEFTVTPKVIKCYEMNILISQILPYLILIIAFSILLYPYRIDSISSGYDKPIIAIYWVGYNAVMFLLLFLIYLGDKRKADAQNGF